MKNWKKNDNEIKKCSEFIIKTYNEIQKEQEVQERIKREEAKKEQLIQKEEEDFSSHNDNLGLINDFKLTNFENIKCIENISTESLKTVAVFCYIENITRLYKMAYAYNSNVCSDIVIYDLISNKIDNIIGGIPYINYLKHYYHASTKKHYLLSVSSEEAKLWKIHHSNQLEQILSLSSTRFACVLFIQEKLLICGGKYDTNFKVLDQNGNEIKSISKINTRGICDNIETAYFKDKDKNYILYWKSESSSYFSECYNYDEDTIKTYKNKDDKDYFSYLNLFKKGEKIYLMNCSKNRINIFDFYTTEFIKEISLDNSQNTVRSLCSISQKYLLASIAGDIHKIKIIDMDNYSVVNQSSFYRYYNYNKDCIYGIEKIKIPEKGECIIIYTSYSIKIFVV